MCEYVGRLVSAKHRIVMVAYIPLSSCRLMWILPTYLYTSYNHSIAFVLCPLPVRPAPLPKVVSNKKMPSS
jgi:hypothetical protein